MLKIILFSFKFCGLFKDNQQDWLIHIFPPTGWKNTFVGIISFLFPLFLYRVHTSMLESSFLPMNSLRVLDPNKDNEE